MNVYEMVQSKQDAGHAAKAAVRILDKNDCKNTDWNAVVTELEAAARYAKRARFLAKKTFG